MTDVAGVTGATNPLPAVGGTDPESLEEVRQHAPSAFLTQERAVTVEDWVEVAERLTEVQRAACRFRWTGSWWTVFLTLDLFGGARLADDPRLAARLRDRLDGYRIAGYDLELRDPVDVPVGLRLHVCVAPGRFRADVLRRVEEVLSNRVGGDGVLGLFHPDRFTFGQPVYASTIVAAVSAVPGVTDVRIVELHPVGVLPQGEAEAGLLPIGDLEVARLDDDPSAPERGMLHVDLEGGL
jgi:predicted phage baseplate assembly protein